jgi:hypothetical protein
MAENPSRFFYRNTEKREAHKSTTGDLFASKKGPLKKFQWEHSITDLGSGDEFLLKKFGKM